MTLGRAKVTLVQHTDSCTGCPGSAGVGVILGLGARNPMARDHVCWEIGLEGYRVCFGVGFDVGARAKQKGDESDSVPRFQMEWGNLQGSGPTR